MKINWDLLVKLIEKFRDEAERCLDRGIYLAGLVLVRAALEAALQSRFLLELYSWPKKRLKKYNITINGNKIKVPFMDKLKTLIDEAYKQKLISKMGFDAAHRIREWGNKIHPNVIANSDRLPKIGGRNLTARLKDLDLVIKQLINTI